jgi:Family of unknown function (DUF5683)
MKLIAVVFLLVGMTSYCAFGSPPDSLSAAKAAPIPQTSKDSLAKQPPVKQVPAVQSTPAKKPSIEEEDLLIEESDVKKNAAREAAIKDSLAKIQAANPVRADSTAKAASVSDSGHGPAQAAGAVNSEQPGIKKDSAAIEAPVTAEKPKEVVPVTIESVHSINFAKNLKDYRSPKMAMFLSLIVPGLGQAYTKHYVRAGIFIAIEAAAIGGAIVYNAKGKNEYNAAKNFADENYSSDNFSAYYGLLQTYLGQPSQLGTDSAALAELNGIYFDSLPAIKALAASKSPAFYSSLEGTSNPYVQGWNDCEPRFSEHDNPVGGSSNSGVSSIGGGKLFTYQTHPDSSNASGQVLYYLVDRLSGTSVVESGIFGYSPNQIAYTNMMSKSNDYYKLANTILALMIINHVASAVDALIGAYAYNNQLLGKETLWQHVKVSPQFAMDLVNPSLGLALKVGF